MCGIIGSLGKIEIDKFSKGLNSILHRGPDFNDKYVDIKNKMALGHSRLSIIDTSKNGNQPMHYEDQLVITFNGEIYNFKVLKKMLEEKGILFKSNSDTEVLLAMYSIYKKDMVQFLNGIFAFAIWDKKNKTLFIARDFIGVKPLYYYYNHSEFHFASEIKALLHLTSHKNKANIDSIIKHLSFLWSSSNETAFKNIYKLNPGEAIQMDTKNNFIKYKWKNNKIKINKTINKNKSDVLYETEYKIKKAVEKQLISDVNLGVLLSGGVDSSLITALALKYKNDLNAFTIFFNKGNEDEMADDFKYAKFLSNDLSFKLNSINFNYKNIEQDIKNIIFFLEEPVADLATLNLYYITKLSKEMNYKVLLSGAGADDIFTGYRRHSALYLQSKLGPLFNLTLKSLSAIKPFLSSSLNQLTYRRISKLININSSSSENNLSNYFLWTNLSDLNNLITSDFKDLIIKEKIFKDFDEYYNLIPSKLNLVDKMLLLEQRFFLTEHNLNYIDKISMSNGIEVRVPYLDVDLLEYVNSIHHSYKIDLFSNKKILKSISKKYIPDKIITRKKAGFGSPVKKLIKENLKEYINDTFSSSDFLNRGLFDKNSVRRIVNDNQNGYEDYSYSILSLLFIEIWFKIFRVSI